MKTSEFLKKSGVFILIILFISTNQSQALAKTYSQYSENYLSNHNEVTYKSEIFKTPNQTNQDTITPEIPGDITIIKLLNISDTLEQDPSQKAGFHFGIGSGVGSDGGIFGTEVVFVSSYKWGGKIGFSSSISKYKNLPSDYFTAGTHLFSPKNYVNLISFNLFREFKVPGKSLTFGLEAGASRVIYSYAVITENPDYNPADPWAALFDMNKYLKYHESSKSWGATFRASMGLLVTPYVGFEFAVFTSINDVQPVTGLEIFIIFGKLKN
jgi:hypothetical protein